MKSKRNRVGAAAAIVAGLIVSALPAAAQYRRDDGRALDANRRIGSGGANDDANNRTGSRVTGNQVVTGNVTGGREFRGPVGYRDPADFRGPLGTDLSDQFVRDSTGAPRSYAPSIDLTSPQAFYGQSRVTPPPPGYVPTAGASGGYIAVAPLDPSALQTPWSSRTIGSEYRGVNEGLTQRFSELVLPGPAGDTANGSADTFISASPLYGVRLFRPDQINGDPTQAAGDKNQELSPLDKLGLTDRSIEKMREELNNVNNPRPRSQQGSDEQKEGTDSDKPGTNGPRPINQPLQGNITNDPTGGNQQGGPAGTGNLGGMNARQRLLVPASEQSELYRALEQMYLRQNANRPPNELELAHQTQSLQTVQRKAAEEAAAKKPGTPDAAPGTARKPAAGTGTGVTGRVPTPRVAPTTRTGPVNPSTPETKTPPQPVEPLNVESLATGVKAKGLADLLKGAEDLMKQGKYTSAIQKYELAARVAPNNALITLGRAHAELGASLYGQAENDLRRAILTQPALLMGRYNLRTFIGEERMGFLVKDLKEISEKDSKQLRPLLLLAYIAYNTGNADQARDHLERALKLASADPVLLAMREHWALKGKESDAKPTPAADPAATPAKPAEKPAAPEKDATPEKDPTPDLNK